MVDKKPNILWICTDQQRYDSIQALGNKHVHTPHIDKLAEEGVTFRRAYAQSPVCTPSRASFLTGRYPRTTRVTYNGNDDFPADEVLVTKMMADEGYDCGLVGKLHLSAAEGIVEKRTNDGYTTFKWSQHPHDDWPGANDYQLWLKERGIEWDEHYHLGDWKNIFPKGEGGLPAEYQQTTWCAEEAIQFMEEKTDKPWLLSVNMFDPHPPFDPPLAYRERFNVEDMPLPKWKDGEMDNKPSIQQEDVKHGGQAGTGPCYTDMSDEQKQQATADYYAMVELIDEQVGRMMETLKATNQLDNTVVIFHSDHGEMLGDHGLYWKGAYFYEELVHVPLIISYPKKLQQNIQSNALVELVDLAPTILDLAGLDIPYYMQGRSLVSLMKGEVDPDYHKDYVYCEYYYALKEIHDVYATMYFDGTHKIIVHHEDTLGELYNLEQDPDEFDNLWSDPDYQTEKFELVKKCFDASIKTLDPISPTMRYY